MENGYISLHRKIIKNWIWENETYLKWWIDLLFMAGYEKRKILVNGEMEIMEIGEFHTSLLTLSERWFTSRKRVDNFLKILEKDEMIELKKTRQHGTTIKVSNYQAYQVKNEDDGTTEEQRNCTFSKNFTDEKGTTEKSSNNRGKPPKNSTAGTTNVATNVTTIVTTEEQHNNKYNNIIIPPLYPPQGGNGEIENQENESNVETVDGDEAFETLCKIYPRSNGSSEAKKHYMGFLTNGRSFAGHPLTKLNHWQIFAAVKKFITEMEQEERETDKMPYFSTLFNANMIDYVKKSQIGYENSMNKKYGENWREKKFKYIFAYPKEKRKRKGGATTS